MTAAKSSVNSDRGARGIEPLLTREQWQALESSEREVNEDYKTTRSGDRLDAWLAWIDLGGSSPSTIRTYRWRLHTLFTAYPTKDIGDFTTADLALWVRSKPKDAHRYYETTARQFFRWAKRTRLIAENPMDEFPKIKAAPPAEIDVFTETERAMLSALDLRDGVLFDLLFGSGLRKTEAALLTGKDIDLDTGRLIVRKGKGGKARAIPLSPHVLSRVAQLVLFDGIGPDDHFWYTKKANETSERVNRRTPASGTAMQRWWTTRLTEAGVRHRKMHTTRHTYATELIRSGVQTAVVSRLLGHSSVAITDATYTHLVVEDLAAELAKVW